MKHYTVLKPFWANPQSVNWNIEEYGQEGAGIPKALVNKAHKEGQMIRVTIEERGNIYEVRPEKILEHDKKWNTGKTAPAGAKNIFIIIPVSLMQFKGYTPEKEAKIRRQEAEEREKQRLAEMQTSLF